jgi:hypothetical protein
MFVQVMDVLVQDPTIRPHQMFLSMEFLLTGREIVGQVIVVDLRVMVVH